MTGNGSSKRHVRLALQLAVLAGVLTAPRQAIADGGWSQQTVALQAGWNVVWLEVDPVPADPADPASPFFSLDYEAIWAFAPGRLPGDRGAWATYRPDAPPFVNSLRVLRGDQGYLIKMNTAGGLMLTGQPVNRKSFISGQTRTIVGAQVNAASPPTFGQHFSHPNVQNKLTAAHRMNANGTFTQLAATPTSLNNQVLQPNVGYWVLSTQDLSYGGPVDVNLPLAGLQLGINGYSQQIRVEVPQGTAAITVRALPSAQPPAGEPSDQQGDASWLEYLVTGTQGERTWLPFPAPGVQLPGTSTIRTLEVRGVRRGLGPATENVATATAGGGPSSYQGQIEFSDGKNKTIVAAGMEVEPIYGIWIGQARLTHVNTQSAIQNPPVMAPARSLSMSLILAIPVPDTPGESIRLLDKEFVEVDRDGRTLQYTYNPVLFHEAVQLSGGIGGELVGSTTIAADHPLNPYRHRYHPEHGTGYAVKRDIVVKLTDPEDGDPDPLNTALGLDESVGDNELVGEYSETITGLSVEPIVVSGTFKLHRLSNTTDLRGTSN